MFIKILDINYSPLFSNAVVSNFNSVIKKAEDIEESIVGETMIDNVLVLSWMEQMHAGSASKKNSKKEGEISLILPSSVNVKNGTPNTSGYSNAHLLP